MLTLDCSWFKLRLLLFTAVICFYKIVPHGVQSKFIMERSPVKSHKSSEKKTKNKIWRKKIACDDAVRVIFRDFLLRKNGTKNSFFNYTLSFRTYTKLISNLRWRACTFISPFSFSVLLSSFSDIRTILMLQ